MKCTKCGDAVDIGNMAVVRCGHVYHTTCVKDLFSSKRNWTCPESKCKYYYNDIEFEDRFIEIRHADQSDDEMNEENVQEHRNTQVLCTICNHEFTDINKMAANICGHLNHYECVVEYLRPRRAKINRCLVESCEEILKLGSTLKIIPNHMDLQTNVRRSDIQVSARTSKKGRASLHVAEMKKMKKKYETLKKDIREWESHYKHVKSRLDNTLKDLDRVKDENKTLKKNAETLQSQATPGTSKEGQASSQVAEMDKILHDAEMEKLTHFEELAKMICKYERLKQETGELERHCTHVKSKLAMANTEMTNVKDDNETLTKVVASLQSQVSSLTAELGEANSKLSEMDKLKDENKALLKDVQSLQSEVITARDANIALQTEMRDLATQNENLSTLKEMKNQVSSLTAELGEANSKLSEMDKVKDENKALLKDVQSLQSQVSSLTAELGEANSKLSEMDKVKEKNEALLKNVKGLQSHCTYVKSKLAKANKEITNVKDENETLTRDIASLQSHCTYVKTKLRKSNTGMTKDENETLKKDIASLQSQVSSLTAELGEANSKLSEMDKLKDENKALLKDVQSLQSEVITVRDTNIALQTEMRDLATRNENLSTLNEEMKNEVITVRDTNIALQTEMRDLATQNENLSTLNEEMKNEVITVRDTNIALQTEMRDLATQNENLSTLNEEMKNDMKQLKNDFALHESSITDFMMNEVQRTLQQDAVEQSLNRQILTLQADNDNLRRDNQELRTENKYRWEQLKAMHTISRSVP